MKISIITINYNNYFGLQNTITSVVSQSYFNIEYIVIDGGSNDGSVDVIKRFSNKINYWISEPDSGIYDAMNKGIKMCNGELICFLNSGDLYNGSFALELVVNKIKNSDAELFFGNYILVNKSNTANLVKIGCVKYKSDLLTSSFAHPATFYKSNLFNKIGLFNINYKIVSDVDWYLKALITYKISFMQLDYSPAIFFEGGISTTAVDIVSNEYSKMINNLFSKFEIKFYSGRTYKILMKVRLTKILIVKLMKLNLNKLRNKNEF